MRMQIIRGLENIVHESNSKSLNQLRNEMDAHLQIFQSICNSIAVNPRLISLFSQDLGYNSLEAMRELSRYKESGNAIHAIGIYYPHTGNIISNLGLMTLEYFFDRAFHNGIIDKESFLAICASHNIPIQIPFPRVYSFWSHPVDLVIFLYPIPIQNRIPSSYVLFLVRQDYIQGILEIANIGNNSIVYVIDTNFGSRLSVAGGNLVEMEDRLYNSLQSLNVQNNHTLNIEGEKFHILEASGFLDFSYIIATPMSRYFGPVNDSNRIFMITLIIITFLGLVYSVVVARQNYRPIGKLANTLAELPNDDFHNTDNKEKPIDLVWIQRRLDKLKEVNISLHNSLYSNQGLIRQQLLFNILTTGNINITEFQLMLKAIQINLDSGFFQVIATDLELVEEKLPVVIVYLKNTMEELFKDLGSGYYIEGFENNTFYFLLHSQLNITKDEIIHILDTLRSHITETIGCIITTGIGRTQTDMANINLSYRQAVESLQYKSINGSGFDVFYDDISGPRHGDLYYLSLICAQLEEALKAGDYQLSVSVMDNLSKELKAGNSGPEVLPYISWSLYTSMLSVIKQLNLQETILGQMDSIFKSKDLSLEKLQAQYLAICQDLCIKVNIGKDKSSGKLLEKIYTFVQQNISDRNLTLESMADNLGFNPSYLTRFFKIQTNESLMKYVDKLRMEKAKELLRTSHSNLDQILLACGYIDKDNFCRKFKRYERLTPMQYRNLLNNEEKQ